jgi:hypothetical protein
MTNSALFPFCFIDFHTTHSPFSHIPKKETNLHTLTIRQLIQNVSRSPDPQLHSKADFIAAHITDIVVMKFRPGDRLVCFIILIHERGRIVLKKSHLFGFMPLSQTIIDPLLIYLRKTYGETRIVIPQPLRKYNCFCSIPHYLLDKLLRSIPQMEISELWTREVVRRLRPICKLPATFHEDLWEAAVRFLSRRVPDQIKEEIRIAIEDLEDEEVVNIYRERLTDLSSVFFLRNRRYFVARHESATFLLWIT